jgi:hypothetical protein
MENRLQAGRTLTSTGGRMAVNYLAVLVAAIASWFVGGAWYGVFGKPWMAALGLSREQLRPGGSMPIAPFVTSFVGELIMAAMFAILLLHLGGPSVLRGIIAAALCWIAFIAPTITVNNAFQKRPLPLTLIDGGHWLAVLVVQAIVLGLFG